MKKVTKIKNFIIVHKPTRKELTQFIVVNINGICSALEYDNNAQRGYYGTNISEWKQNGHIEVINKRYTITEESQKLGLSMYKTLPSVKLQRAENIASNYKVYYKDECEESKRLRNELNSKPNYDELVQQLAEANTIIRNIKMIVL